ncbi:DUF4232 domain-containing protein [Streptacidiphilus carbonis]|uniref:DUF4232 domain-containing protein n=1 Tax=Streptacidiphilus carbonis TaxID=105422 RepID=UPI0005A81DC3|nr:hypothetical protein [Streptacidiphilus carbonis]
MSTFSGGDEDREDRQPLPDGDNGTPAGNHTSAGDGAAAGDGTPASGSGSGPDDARPKSEPRARVRVVRPGGGIAGAPPMPVAPPTALPPWLDPANAAGPAAALPPTASAGHGPRPDPALRSDPVLRSDPGPRPGTGPGGPAAPAPEFRHGSALDPDQHLAPDERELRDLLHRAVGGLQPSAGALDQLRRAVPQRRQRRRRMYGSAALTAGLCLIGGLALHSAAGSVLDSGPQTTQGYGDTASNHSAPGGAGISSSPSYSPLLPYPSLGSGGILGGTTSGGGSSNAVSALPGSPGSGQLQPSGRSSGGRAGTTTPSPGAPIVPVASSGPGSSSVASPVSTAPAAAECVQSQLGAGSSKVGAADSAGVVYGTFLVTNVSSKTCAVSLPGTVSVLSVSGTDASRVTITQHTAGDPAGGLPAPDPHPAPVTLAPGKSYAVGFAWVPTTGAGAPSCVTASPTGSDSAAATAGSGSAQTQSGGTGQPSVTLGHVPGAGGSAVSATVPNACAGTVYRTAPLATAG